MTDSPSPSSRSTSGHLLGLLTAGFYVLFTLLPDSNGLMVSWPWVFLWQIALLCPVLWFIGLLWQRRAQWLGNHLDWLVGCGILGLVLSASLAQFPMQARWYSWAAFCGMAALYAVRSWAVTIARRQRLLTALGCLQGAFILLSLGLWISQVFWPEIGQLNTLRPYGINLSYDFGQIQLRNWVPIGHQNYVAGYLVLALPLLLGLGIQAQGRSRWLWLSLVGLGLIDLYTTQSRAGWLAIGGVGVVSCGGWLWRSQIPLHWRWLGGGVGMSLVMGTLLGNSRVRETLMGLASGRGDGELAYRLITITAGWQMGRQHWVSGVGLGGAPLLYQRFRPYWAGREAEGVYQLHSTPAHLWAELGLWSVLLSLGLLLWLLSDGARWWQRVSLRPTGLPTYLVASLYAGLLGYGLLSLADYQLDNLSISGTIVLYLALLSAEFHRTPAIDPETEVSSERWLAWPLTLAPVMAWMGVGVGLAAIVWLMPIHRAWMLSSQGFTTLNRTSDATVLLDHLKQAEKLVPWEPYYPLQLGWQLGNLSLQTTDSKQQGALTQQGIQALQRGIHLSPYWEFGHSNQAWLSLSQNPAAAAKGFARSAALIPAKRGVMYGLGLSLLALNQVDRALDAFTLELLRDPILLTSPVWTMPQLRALYQPLTQRLEARYGQCLQTVDPGLNRYCTQNRAALRWWVGDLAGAAADWNTLADPKTPALTIGQTILQIAQGQAVQSAPEPTSADFQTIAAWLNPEQRSLWLRRAWITATRRNPSEALVNQLVSTMNGSATLDQWLKQTAPTQQYRRERPGFSTLSRHTEGSNPVDFLTVVDNIPMTQLMASLMSSPAYLPELDHWLQPDRDRLVQRLLE